MRYLFGFLCVCALGMMPLIGCSEATPECQIDRDCDDQNECTEDRCDAGLCENTAVADGTACEGSTECTVAACVSGACESTPVADGTACGNDAGACQQGSCQVACTEQGIRDAISAGGGPYTFGCVGPTMVVTEAEIVVDNDVVLDGEGNLTVDGNEDHRVFFVNGGVTAELIGLTVTRGHLGLGDIVERDLHGAGIMNEGVLTLANSTVTECLARFVSGQFTPSGRHGGRGGGIHNTISGTMTLRDSAVSNNVAGSYGGGIDNDGVMNITDSTVSGSSSGLQGGGIASLGTLTLTNSTVSGNTADGAGGIDNTGTLTLMNSAVSENNAHVGGIDNYGTAMLMNTTVAGNSGGGISNATWGVIAVVNSTVSGNTGSTFGGISSRGGSVELINSTVSDNTATAPGAVAGLRNSSDYVEPQMTVTRTLVDNDCYGITASGGYNIESPGNTCGFDQPGDQVNVSADDLQLGPLQDNSGPTQTQALGTGSVAIDRVPESDCVDADGKPLTTDQRGVERPQGSACDVGAVEMAVTP